MSETGAIGKTNRKRQLTLGVAALIVVSLLAYGAGIILLPVSILSNYKSGNCAATLRLDGIYTNLYPAFVEDTTLTGPVMECGVITLAGQYARSEAWQEAWNSYTVYSNTYPNGLFSTEAREQGAGSLLGLLKEQAESGRYAEALNNLRTLEAGYADTAAAQEAEGLFSAIYTDWGIHLRDSGQYEEAERIFLDFKSWAQRGEQHDQEAAAQRELALTYFNWGLALQASGDFDSAGVKLEVAASSDEELSSKVEANRFTLHKEWGDALLAQGEYALAMEQYRSAISVADSANQGAAEDAVTNAYIQWAAGLSSDEDFLGALAQIERAQETVVNDAIQSSVDEARAETLLAFSKSEGEQAKQAMQDALRKVCELRERPDLQIFGLDEASVRAGVYGVDIELPEDIAASTPGELHYVVCVDESDEVIQFVDFYGYQMSRIRVVWDVELRDVTTGGIVADQQFEGSDPAPLPTEPGAIVAGGFVQKYEGNPPQLSELTEWMSSEMT